MIRLSITYLFFVSLVSSCDFKDNEVEPSDHFTKVYDDNGQGGDFRPKALAKDGEEFVILSELGASSFKPIFLQKIDAQGVLADSFTSNSGFVNPLPTIIEQNGEHLIIAMDQLTLFTHVLSIDWENGNLVSVQQIGVEYPIAISKVNNGFLLLGFSISDRSSYLTYFNNNFQVQWQEEFLVFEDPPQFGRHITEEAPLPFFTGQLNNSKFYFNGFYNQKLAMVFVNANDGSFFKAVEGHRYEASVSSVYPLNNGKFFLTKYNTTGSNSILDEIDLQPNSPNVLNVLNEEDIPEQIKQGYPIRNEFLTKQLFINNIKKLVVLAPTINSQTELQVRNTITGRLEKVLTVGDGTVFLPKDCLIDSDDRLVLLGQTFTANKLPRIALIRLSELEMELLK